MSTSYSYIRDERTGMAHVSWPMVSSGALSDIAAYQESATLTASPASGRWHARLTHTLLSARFPRGGRPAPHLGRAGLSGSYRSFSGGRQEGP